MCTVLLSPGVNTIAVNKCIISISGPCLHPLACQDGLWFVDLGRLTLILLMWRIWWAHNNANKWQMGFYSAFKGLKVVMVVTAEGPLITYQWQLVIWTRLHLLKAFCNVKCARPSSQPHDWDKHKVRGIRFPNIPPVNCDIHDTNQNTCDT
jgi:hypothetical protein